MAFGAVTNFKSRLQDIISSYTGSSGGIMDTDDAAVQQFIIDGCYDVIEKVKVQDIGSIWEFCSSTTFNNNDGQDFDESLDIVGVERNGFPARAVDFQLRARLADSDSIHFATEKDPVFYVGPDTSGNARKLYMLPAATVTEPGQVYFIPDFTITSFDSSTSSIDNFPRKYYEHILIYAAMRILERHHIDLVNEEEDIELASAIQNSIVLLKSRYLEMFGKPNLGVKE